MGAVHVPARRVVISTPSKCGTTWMQTIVGMLLLDRTDLGAPISTHLAVARHADPHRRRGVRAPRASAHRRFIKTHTPLDGVPRLPSVTYIAVIRHPLDVALSDLDHGDNERFDRLVELRTAAVGSEAPAEGALDDAPESRMLPALVHRQRGGADRQRAVRSRRLLPADSHVLGRAAEPNVHLFHYADLWADRDREMRRVAAVLGVPVDEDRWPAFVEAAGIDVDAVTRRRHRSRGASGIWRSPERFFRVGGTRDWASLLDDRDVAHFDERLRELAGDATDWVLRGRVALGENSGHPPG